MKKIIFYSIVTILGIIAVIGIFQIINYEKPKVTGGPLNPTLPIPTIINPITIEKRIIINENSDQLNLFGIYNPTNKTINAKIQGDPECVKLSEGIDSLIQIDSLTTPIDPGTYEKINVVITSKGIIGTYVCQLQVYDDEELISKNQVEVIITE